MLVGESATTGNDIDGQFRSQICFHVRSCFEAGTGNHPISLLQYPDAALDLGARKAAVQRYQHDERSARMEILLRAV